MFHEALLRSDVPYYALPRCVGLPVKPEKGKLKFPEAQSLECLRTQSRSLLSAAPTIPSRNLAWHLPHPDGAAWKNATDATAREHWLKYPRSVFAFHPCGSGIHSLNAG